MRPLPRGKFKRVLLVAPHPDDETIAAFGLVRRLLWEGADVRILIVTDGAASHRSRKWPPDRLAAQRRKETENAMRRLGIPCNAIRFLGLPDSGLERLSPSARQRLARAFSRSPCPDLIIRPAASDHHADHQIVAGICRRAWPPRVPQLTYVVWPDPALPPHRPRFVHRLGQTRLMKRAAISAYRTQTGLITDDPHGFCMGRQMVSRFAGPAEYFARA